MKERNNTNRDQNKVIYHIPASTSYSYYDSSGNNIKIPIQQIVNRTLANINTHGYAVISLAPEYFIQSNGSPQEILKEDEIKELAILIDSLLSKGISIHNFSKLAGIKTTIVENQTVNSIEKSNTDQTFNSNKTTFENDTIKIRNQKKHADTNGPTINDSTLRVEQIVHLDNITTGMAFLSENDILVLEKNNGTVQRVVNGKIMPKPVLDVNVANKQERGMLGIAIAKEGENNEKNNSDTYGRTYIYLFFTESEDKDGADFRPNNEPLGSRLYRYEFSNNKLINPKLLLDFRPLLHKRTLKRLITEVKYW